MESSLDIFRRHLDYCIQSGDIDGASVLLGCIEDMESTTASCASRLESVGFSR